MRTINLSMTYQPKIDRVKSGEINQTIRTWSKRYIEAKHLNIFGWSGKPYRSKWGWRIRATVTEWFVIEKRNGYWVAHDHIPQRFQWGDEYSNGLARLDGIDPPTGKELENVLSSLNGKIPDKLIVIRWIKDGDA